MYNHYVDSLGTKEADDQQQYKDMGKRLAKKGYKFPPFFFRPLVRRILNKKFD